MERRRLAAILVGALLMLLAAEARAEQFVLFDATFTYTWDDAVNAKPSKSHYYVNEGNWLNKQRPVNWSGPVNYRDGKVHIRAEVLEKPPGTQQAGWALCYVANVGSYGCPYTDYYKSVGVYERDVDMRSFYNNATIQWDKGVKQVDLVYTINGSGSGHVTNFPELKDLVTPTKVRITMVQVSMGATYDPSILATTKPAEPGRDGGAEAGTDASAAAGTGGVVDPPTPDAGAAGTTGAAGTGATAGTGGEPSGAAGTTGAAGTSGAAATTGVAGMRGDASGRGGCTISGGGSVGYGALIALVALAACFRRQKTPRRQGAPATSRAWPDQI
jgi:hypothetical protein